MVYEIDSQCVHRFKLRCRTGELVFSLGTDLPTRTRRFGTLAIDETLDCIIFVPRRIGMDNRRVLFFLNGDDFMPRGKDVVQLKKRLQVLLAKPYWRITDGVMRYNGVNFVPDFETPYTLD